MKTYAWIGLGMGLVSLSLTACAPSQWEYLGRANGHATQEEITERLGDPQQAQTLPDQTQVWTYRYEDSGSFPGLRADMRGGASCIEYVLTFDSKKTLTYWTRKPCHTL